MANSDHLPAKTDWAAGSDSGIREALRLGVVLPAMPLALNAHRRLDERRQRALCRYYLAAGAGGVAVGVHTTQFAIREPRHGLFRPILALVADELARHETITGSVPIRIAGLCGDTVQAVAEGALARALGYHAVLLSLAALKDAEERILLDHCRAVSKIMPLVGFYLQPAIGGRVLPISFWRRFAEIESVVAIKVAPFNRYQTLDVVRAVAESGRDDIALYTGNDDHIVLDLIAPFRFQVNGRMVERRFVGGLLGQWAVWTRQAVALLAECHAFANTSGAVANQLLRVANDMTAANSAIFDVSHGFAGCIPGIHEVLCRQGLLDSTRCLDPNERLSPGQAEEIDRVYRAYPHLNDDAFVSLHREEWLRA